MISYVNSRFFIVVTSWFPTIVVKFTPSKRIIIVWKYDYQCCSDLISIIKYLRIWMHKQHWWYYCILGTLQDHQRRCICHLFPCKPDILRPIHSQEWTKKWGDSKVLSCRTFKVQVTNGQVVGLGLVSKGSFIKWLYSTRLIFCLASSI